MKKIAIGCDPNAAELKAVVMQQLTDLGYEYEDYGSEPRSVNCCFTTSLSSAALGSHPMAIFFMVKSPFKDILPAQNERDRGLT